MFVFPYNTHTHTQYIFIYVTRAHAHLAYAHEKAGKEETERAARETERVSTMLARAVARGHENGVQGQLQRLREIHAGGQVESNAAKPAPAEHQ